jgi:leucyl-tRNA synthetase
LLYNGYINAPDGKKMSKSKGNVIDPLDVIDQGYGADTLRTYEMFIGPYDMDAAWDPKSVGGVYRFLNRCWTLCFKHEIKDVKNEVIRNKTIKKVTDDIHKHNFNTAVSAMMEYVNELYKVGATADDLVTLAKLLKPFAPHLACEILEKLKADDVWPVWDEKYLVSDTVELVVQVNGKLRAKIQVSVDDLEDQAKIEKLALAEKNVQTFTKGGIKKVIYVKKAKLLNLVA